MLWRPRWLKARRKVVVYLTTDDIFEGLLILNARDGLALYDVTVRSESKDVRLGGEVFVPNDKIRFVQEV